MKKIYLLIFLFFVIILTALFIFYDRYSFAYEEEKSHDTISKNIDIFEEYLNEQKQYALSLSIMLSKDMLIQKALLTKNQALALKEIHKILNDIADSTGIDNIDIQVHTKDTKAFARNWDNSDYLGVKLASFRKGLLHVKKTKEPFASIELGKRLNIKAISPILDQNEEFIGSLEVIMDFQNIKKRLEKSNIQMLALLDERYINIAVDLTNHLRLQKYYIVEKNFSRFLYQMLKENPEILKQEEFFYKIKNKVIAFLPMKSLGIQKVGSIVLAMDAQNRHDYNYPIERIVFENSQYRYDKNKQREVIIK
jgi:hypothetical protein